jgi:UDP-N-acetylglucosamine--N-acetylmuramyl-(pentapeptide) pyrophosphoryl-undecaprenol N-acetylglucosamine transferase
MGLKVALACGGTGGHVFPALAVGKSLRDNHGAETFVVGRPSSMEERLAAQSDVRFRQVPAVPLHRARWWKNILLPWHAWKTVASAAKVLREEKPDAVFATGGYVCLPTGVAARLAGIPVFVHESNSHPGIANRLLGRLATGLFAGSPAGAAALGRKAVVTGSPVRELDGRTREALRSARGLSGSDRFLVVIGGSQGARGVNRILSAEVGTFLADGWQVLWQTGPAELEAIRSKVPSHPHLQIEAFVTDMYGVFGAADLGLTRAGASTLAELALHGLPALLVPFPAATGNHQEINAREFERAGAATVVLEKDWTEGVAKSALDALWARRAEAAKAMASFARPDCAARLAEAVVAGRRGA